MHSIVLLFHITIAIVLVPNVVYGDEEKPIEIPITPDIKKMLLEKNPSLFNNPDEPKRATCRCKLESVDISTYENQWFLPPVHEKWSDFMKAKGISLGAEYDVNTNRVSWKALLIFRSYLQTEYKITLTITELLALVSDSQIHAERRIQPASKPIDPMCNTTAT